MPQQQYPGQQQYVSYPGQPTVVAVPNPGAPPMYGTLPPSQIENQPLLYYPSQPVAHVGQTTVIVAEEGYHHHHHHLHQEEEYRKLRMKIALIGMCLCLCCGWFPGGFAWLFGGCYLRSRAQDPQQRRAASFFIAIGLFALVGGALILSLVIVPAIKNAQTCSVPTPYNLYAMNTYVGGTPAIQLSWEIDTGSGDCSVSYFNVWYQDVNFGTQGNVEPITGDYVTLTGVNLGDTYKFEVTAYNNNKGWGPASDVLVYSS